MNCEVCDRSFQHWTKRAQIDKNGTCSPHCWKKYLRAQRIKNAHEEGDLVTLRAHRLLGGAK